MTETVKLNAYTLDVFKNFATINSGILITENKSYLRTISPSKAIFGGASIDNSFPSRFAIYDLGEFLSTLNLFSDPELNFDSDRYVTIRESSSDNSPEVKYHFAAENLIVKPPEKEIQFPDEIEVTFNLEQSTFDKLQKAAATLNVSDLVVTRSGDEILLVVKDKKSDSSNNYSVPVGEYGGDENDKFEFHFQMDNLKMMKNDYSVEISSKGLSRFHNSQLDLEYFVAIESTSYFNS